VHDIALRLGCRFSVAVRCPLRFGQLTLQLLVLLLEHRDLTQALQARSLSRGTVAQDPLALLFV
jgi:hypothetical protein